MSEVIMWIHWLLFGLIISVTALLTLYIDPYAVNEKKELFFVLCLGFGAMFGALMLRRDLKKSETLE